MDWADLLDKTAAAGDGKVMPAEEGGDKVVNVE
jgi:hypothetical protein